MVKTRLLLKRLSQQNMTNNLRVKEEKEQLREILRLDKKRRTKENQGWLYYLQLLWLEDVTRFRIIGLVWVK